MVWWEVVPESFVSQGVLDLEEPEGPLFFFEEGKGLLAHWGSALYPIGSEHYTPLCPFLLYLCPFDPHHPLPKQSVGRRFLELGMGGPSLTVLPITTLCIIFSRGVPDIRPIRLVRLPLTLATCRWGLKPWLFLLGFQFFVWVGAWVVDSDQHHPSKNLQQV